MNETNVKQNSLRAWILAARPKTLTGAIVPVMIGLALAWKDLRNEDLQVLNSSLFTLHSSFRALPALLCFLFAIIMQICANFVNDYFDWRKGNDKIETRLGPLRACSMGWITPRAIQIGIAVSIIIAGIVGLPLIYYGGWQMLLVGIACVVFCILYTTTLSYIALGDVLVLVFFGLVPVCLTYYLQTGTISTQALWLSLACGLAIDCLLLVNNYRDIDNDRRDGKRTLVVFIGKQATQWLYFIFGLAAAAIVAFVALVGGKVVFLFFYIILHSFTSKKMEQLTGRDLNKVLGETARNILIYGITVVLCVLL